MKKLLLLNLNLILSLKISIVGLNLDGHGLSQITQGLKKIIAKQHQVDLLYSREKNHGNYDLAIFTDSLTCFDNDLSKNLPRAKLNIAYCLWETNALPKKWVNIINKKFDAVIVASEWYISKYIESGVTKPIFCIPLGLDENKIDLITKASLNKEENNNIFYFTCISSFFRHKNQLLLVEAFDEIFQNNSNVGLILSGHAPTYDNYYSNIVKKLEQLKNPNIILNSEQLNDVEFAKLINKTSVLVSISTGEGYGYTPREAAALGIPTIVAANTAYWDIIENNFASISINCPSTIPAYCVLQKDTIGKGYLCSIENLKLALKDIYHNYKNYKELAEIKKYDVIKSYSWSKIEPLINNLLDYKKWNLSQENKVNKHGIFCNDIKLINKLASLNQ